MPDTKRKIEVMTAYAEGKDIEYRRVGDDGWMHCTQPLWNWAHFDFRVAEEKEEEGVVYVVLVSGTEESRCHSGHHRDSLLWDGNDNRAVFSKKSKADSYCKEMQEMYPELTYKVERVEVVR